MNEFDFGLIPFQPRPECKKCGAIDHMIYYFKHEVPESQHTMSVYIPEHLKVTCSRCGYSFNMKCKG